MAHRLVHLAAVAKTHLDLGRVHVDIDACRVDVDVQRIDRLALAMQDVLIGAAGGVGDDLVAHKSAVDVAELLVGPRPGRVRNAGPAPNLDDRCVIRAAGVGVAGKIDPHGALHKISPQHIGQALLQCRQAACLAAAPPLLDQFAFMPDGKADIGTGQRVAAHGLDAVRQLGRVGFEELAPRRG